MTQSKGGSPMMLYEERQSLHWEEVELDEWIHTGFLFLMTWETDAVDITVPQPERRVYYCNHDSEGQLILMTYLTQIAIFP